MRISTSTAEAYEQDVTTIALFLSSVWNKGVERVPMTQMREIATIEYRRCSPIARYALNR